MQSGDSPRRCEACQGSAFEQRFEKGGHRYERCVTCGVERIEPPPTDAELEQIYGNGYYEAWGLSADGDEVRALKQATFRRVIAAAGTLAPRAKVLDCGAGTGFLMEVAAGLGYEPYGVELSPFGAQTIQARFGADRVWQGQLEDAQFAPVAAERFSAIFMCDYLEHVRDPAGVLRHAAQWLQPGGPLVISTPRAGSLSQRLLGAGWPHYKTEHLFYFTSDGLRTLLERSDFVATKWEPMWKTMTLEYVRHQFETYRHALLTPLARGLRWLPSGVRDRHFRVVMGEMLVVARRTTAHPGSGSSASDRAR